MEPTIIEVAINGGVSKARNPHVPRTPEEIAADALACYDAGAAVIHSHATDLGKTGAAAADEYLAGWRPFKNKRPGAIVYGTVAFAPTIEERCQHTELLAKSGIMSMGFLDPGSTNLATSGENGMPGPMQFVYTYGYPEIDYMVRQLERCRLGPSIAIYEPGFLRAVLAYYKAGRLPAGTLLKLYFGGDHNYLDGVKGGITFGLPPTLKALDAYLEMLGGSDILWAVAVLGGNVVSTGLARAAIERGGHVRVGIEDYAGPHQPSNAELVAEVVAIAGQCGRPVADGPAAAALLNLPRR